MTTQRNGRKAPSAKPVIAPPDVGSERPVEILEARVERLEATLEGLQDAIDRQMVLHDGKIDELDRRTEPHQIARALSQEARSLTGASRRIDDLQVEARYHRERMTAALKSLVGVGGRELHAYEAASDVATEERGPERLGVRNADVDVGYFAAPVMAWSTS